MSDRKRPCRICRRWFSPNPRVGDRQKTCGAPECRREWHRRKCAYWNQKNSDYFKSNYLQKKLDAADRIIADSETKISASSPPSGRSSPKLYIKLVQEVIGIQQAVIIEYLIRLHLRRFQEVIKGQVIVNPG